MKLITHKANLRYLTGFTGSKGFLLLGTKKNYFITDSRYIGFAKKLQKKKTRIFFEVTDSFSKIISKAKVIEFEADHITVSQLKAWKKKFKNKKFVPIKPISRVKKTDNEIKLLKKSQQLNKVAMQRIRKLLKPGVTELEIAWKIREMAHKLNAEGLSFTPIVAFGPNSAIPHHQNTNRRLKKRDIALIDMGLVYKGYCSDLSRTFFIGKPTPEQKAIYKKVEAAHSASIKAIKPGISASKLDRIARKEMGTDKEFFTHSLGHGVGLEIHEAPRLSIKSKDRLQENSIITIEPGIYLPGKFGIRIEDMILVKANGFTKL
jgi:Xaa-Pro aminopeptidase